MGKRRKRRGGKRKGRSSKRSRSIRNKVRGLSRRKSRSQKAARRAQARKRAQARRSRSRRNDSRRNSRTESRGFGSRNSSRGSSNRSSRRGGGGRDNRSGGGGGGGGRNRGPSAAEIQAAREAKKQQRKERRKNIKARVLERKRKRDAKKLGEKKTITGQPVDNNKPKDNRKIAIGTGIEAEGMTYMDPNRWGGGKLETNKNIGQFDKDGNYNFGKQFNQNDIRIMTEGGKSINEIKDYMEQNEVKAKGRFETMFSRINAGKGFDESGENFDYGYRFDNRDINKMFDAGKDQKYISDFISNNEELDDNKIAQKWMGRYGSGGDVDEEPEIDNWQQSLLDRIDGLEKRLAEGGGEQATTTTQPGANPGGLETGLMSPWANTGQQSVFDPMSLYYQMSGTTPGSAAGSTPQAGTALTETVNQQPKVQAPTGADGPQPVQQPAYQAQGYQPMTYQPIGVPGTSQAFNYTNPPSSGYNPSGSGSPLVAPLNAFTQTPQPVGQNGLPVYPTMTYGPGTAPIPGQVTPGGTTPGYAFPQAPGMPGTPNTPSGQVYAGGNPAFDPKTGKYKGPVKPNPKVPQAVVPQFAPLNQLGL